MPTTLESLLLLQRMSKVSKAPFFWERADPKPGLDKDNRQGSRRYPTTYREATVAHCWHLHQSLDMFETGVTMVSQHVGKQRAPCTHGWLLQLQPHLYFNATEWLTTTSLESYGCYSLRSKLTTIFYFRTTNLTKFVENIRVIFVSPNKYIIKINSTIYIIILIVYHRY